MNRVTGTVALITGGARVVLANVLANVLDTNGETLRCRFPECQTSSSGFSLLTSSADLLRFYGALRED